VEAIKPKKNGKYSSVLEMVSDLSEPKFIAKFKKSLKKLTVWVYIDSGSNFVQVFKRLKSAKQFIEGACPELKDTDWAKKIKNKVTAPDGMVWEGDNKKLFKAKIIKA